MKKILVAILFSATLLYAQTGPVQGHSFVGGVQALTSGVKSTNYLNGIIPSATITVYLTGTLTKATIYKDNINTPLSNPFTSNAVGASNPGGWIFYAATGQALDIVASGGIAPNTYSSPVTLAVDVFPSGSGGGGGGSVSYPGATQNYMPMVQTATGPVLTNSPFFCNDGFYFATGQCGAASGPSVAGVGPGTMFVDNAAQDTTINPGVINLTGFGAAYELNGVPLVIYPGVTSTGTGGLQGNNGVGNGWNFNGNSLTLFSLSHGSGNITLVGGFGGSVSLATDQQGIADGYLYINQNATGYRNVLTAKTYAGTGTPSDTCSALQNAFAVEINATPIAYQCSKATGSYAWNTLGGGGSVGPGTNKFFACFSGTTNVGNCHADDGATTASTITATEPVVVAVSGGAAGSIKFGQGTAPSFTSGNGYIFSDALGNMMSNDNAAGSGNICNTVNGHCQPPTTFKTGGVNNSSQTTLNLVAGTNVTLTNTSGGNVTIAASGGGGSGAVTNVTSSVSWTNCTVTGNVCSTTGSVASVTAASLNTSCTGNSLEFDIVPIDAASGQFAFSMELNADATSGDYVGNGNTLAGTSYTGVAGGLRIGVIGDSTTGGQATLHILNFGSSLPKNWYSFTQSNTTTTSAMQDFQGTWFKSGNPAITSVVFLDPTPNNLASGSTFIAYCVN